MRTTNSEKTLTPTPVFCFSAVDNPKVPLLPDGQGFNPTVDATAGRFVSAHELPEEG